MKKTELREQLDAARQAVIAEGLARDSLHAQLIACAKDRDRYRTELEIIRGAVDRSIGSRPPKLFQVPITGGGTTRPFPGTTVTYTNAG